MPSNMKSGHKAKKKAMKSVNDNVAGEKYDSETEIVSPTIKKASGFAALMVDDSDEDYEISKSIGFSALMAEHCSSDELRGSETELEEVKQQKSNERLKPNKNKQKKKKKNKRCDDSDENLDDILKELSLEYTEDGKFKNKNVKDMPEENKTSTKPDSKVSTNSSKKTDSKVSKNLLKKTDSIISTDPSIISDKTDNLTKSDIVSQEGHSDIDNDETIDTMKTKSQKRKEKKVRAKQKTVDSKQAPVLSAVWDDKPENASNEASKKKGRNRKIVAAMQEALKLQQEAEEKAKREEEERIRLEEEAEQRRLEELRIMAELKEKKKRLAKERKEQLRAEGKLLSVKQKQSLVRGQQMIEILKEQGAIVGQQKPRISEKNKRLLKKQRMEQQAIKKNLDDNEEVKLTDEPNQEEDNDQYETKDSSEDSVKDNWEDDSDDELAKTKTNDRSVDKNNKILNQKDKEENKSHVEAMSESDSESSTSSESSGEPECNQKDRLRSQILRRIEHRNQEARLRMSEQCLRAPIICVLGHVDTGKTKILDCLRRTNVQLGEAGGITQQIGATYVPGHILEIQHRHVRSQYRVDELRVPGLLIIDTPGHESFSNLRLRGSSLCDMAVLVVDIMHGLEPQTIESINLLRNKRTPFVVALNKVDRLYDWETGEKNKDFQDILRTQQNHTQMEYKSRVQDVLTQFSEQGLNAKLYYENTNPREYLSVVPTSAITGDGISNLLAIIVLLTQKLLPKRLRYSEQLQASVLEVKRLPGLGTTLDVILANGTLHVGDTIVLAGTEGAISTHIRSLLVPQPMKELRVKGSSYQECTEVRGAQGVRVVGRDMDNAVAGLSLLVAQQPDEVAVCSELVTAEFNSALRSMKLSDRGVHVQASTLGALEALLEFLRSSDVPCACVRVGPIAKRDVSRTAVMLQHGAEHGCILAFDVRVDREVEELANQLNVRIFQADIIYHLLDQFSAFREALREREREKYKHLAVFPCRLRILPNCVFNSRDPIVVGVCVEDGVVRVGTPLCVPESEFVFIGHVISLEVNHKQIESARRGQEVCVKIDPVFGDSPKMCGRHFQITDEIVSRISRESIDACKKYFRDDLLKSDWKLMIELKKLFNII